MGGMTLSTRCVLAGALLLGVVLITGCASSQDEEVRRLRARSLYEQGLRSLADKQISLGLTSLREAVQLDPENPTFHNALGVLLLDLRKPAEAEAEFQRGVALDANYAEAHHNLGLSFAEQGRYDQAIAAYRRSVITTWGGPMLRSTSSAKPRKPCERPSSSSPSSERPITSSGWS